MKDVKTRVVRDFWYGLRVFGETFAYAIVLFVVLDIFMVDYPKLERYMFIAFLIIVPILASIGFIVNYTPLKIENDIVTIPASDQIRTFTDLIIVNPITGLYRRKKYNVNDIENVANGYTKVKSNSKKRSWNVVISGMKNGKSFSQRIDCHNKQVRDEIRNVLKQTISGRVNSDFAI